MTTNTDDERSALASTAAWDEVKCSKCGEYKHYEEGFYKDASTGSRLQTCKDCKKSYASDRRNAAKVNPYPRSDKPKACTQCGVKQEADAYYSNSEARDGLSSWCKSCTKKSTTERHAKRRATLDFPPTTEPKTCTRCGVEKLAEMFNVNRTLSSGRVAQCKDCEKAYRKSRNFPRQSFPKECRNCGPPKIPDDMFNDEPYYSDGREARCIVCIHKKSYAPDAKYTAHDYLRIKEGQGGHCRFYAFDGGEFCEESGKKGTRLHIDHDHVTGEIRGLLCHYHNRRVVGLLDRLSPEEMLALLEYTDKLDPVIELSQKSK